MTKRCAGASALHFNDLATVEAGIEPPGQVRPLPAQRVLRDTEHLLDAKIRVACIDPARGKPIPMPRAIHQQLSALPGPAQ